MVFAGEGCSVLFAGADKPDINNIVGRKICQLKAEIIVIGVPAFIDSIEILFAVFQNGTFKTQLHVFVVMTSADHTAAACHHHCQSHHAAAAGERHRTGLCQIKTAIEAGAVISHCNILKNRKVCRERTVIALPYTCQELIVLVIGVHLLHSAASGKSYFTNYSNLGLS